MVRPACSVIQGAVTDRAQVRKLVRLRRFDYAAQRKLHTIYPTNRGDNADMRGLL